MPTPDTTPWMESTLLYRLTTTATSALVVGLLAWRALRGRQASPPTANDTVWLCSLGLLAALLAARVTWEYMTVLAIPCFLLWMQRLIEMQASRWRWLLFGVAWMLCAAPFPYTREPLREGLGLLLMSPRLYGMLLAFFATLHLLRTSPALVRHPT